jgi:hypothetical protein
MHTNTRMHPTHHSRREERRLGAVGAGARGGWVGGGAGGAGAGDGSATSDLPQRGQKRALGLAVAPQAGQTVPGIVGGSGGAACAPSDCPHCLQKRASGRFSSPHLGHLIADLEKSLRCAHLKVVELECGRVTGVEELDRQAGFSTGQPVVVSLAHVFVVDVEGKV